MCWKFSSTALCYLGPVLQNTTEGPLNTTVANKTVNSHHPLFKQLNYASLHLYLDANTYMLYLFKSREVVYSI